MSPGAGPGEPPVQLELLGLVGHVVVGKVRFDRQVDHGLRLLDDGPAVLAARLLLLDGLGEHPAVEVEPDRRHMPGLLGTEDVARAPDLEVGERDLEPGAELGRVEDRLEALAGFVGEALAPPVEQVGVGAPARSAHPAAELVQLGEPERVGAVDDDRVRVRNVEPRLDDRGADQHVCRARGEGDHHLLERALAHLAVADCEPGAGEHLAQLLGLRLDRLDPVVDIEHLPAAIELAQDRVSDQPGGCLGDPGLDRQPILGRGLDDAQVAHTREREVQGPRDRGRGQGQHVDFAAKLLEPLLRGHPEALLLVDHDEAEVTESDVLREQAVGADHDVDRAVSEARDRRLLLPGRDEARQQRNLHRERREPLAERLMVLRGEDRRRHEHRDLLAVLDRLERGAQRDLGLAVPDVADDEAVHRPPRLHVELGFGNRAQLVGRLLVRERGLHLLLPGRVRPEGMALGGATRCVELEQLLGEVADGLLDARLRPQPLAAAELRELRVLGARVARQPVDLLDGDEHPIDTGERELEIVALLACRTALEHPLVARDPMIDVDDEIARDQPLEDVARDDPPKGARPPDAHRAEELAVGDEDKSVGAAGEAAVEAALDQRDRSRRRRLGEPVRDTDGMAALPEQLGEAWRLVGREHDSSAVLLPPGNALRKLGGARGQQRRLAPPERVTHAQPPRRHGALGLGLPRQLERPGSDEPRLPVARPQVGRWPGLRQLA
jgi:hypothetical protein